MLQIHRLWPAVAIALPLLTAACNDSEALSPVGACASTAVPASSPVAYGQRAVAAALAATSGAAPVRVLLVGDACAAPVLAAPGVVLAEAPESYVVVGQGGETVVVGRDPTGAMYGALDVAERIQAGEALPPATPLTGTPDQPIRAGNLFLLLPIAGERTDRWWFYDEDFWNEYLDLLARARLNVLDLHGMYGLESTLFPNALLYFANSTSFPAVGTARADRDHNVAMLRKIVAMSAERGIKVGIMTYRSDLTLDGTAPGPDLTDDQVGTYTREAAADLARSVPDLWRMGFRIWESNHPPDWYVTTFVAGLRDSGTNVKLYSRSWGTAKTSMIQIADAAPGDTIVEVKYNGEHLGAPYVITGGILSGLVWWNYSYADYLQAPDPFTFVFQIRSGGTHRLFREASLARARSAIAGAKIGPAQGISLEAAHAFFPARDDYHAQDDDRFSPWTFRRDELQYLMYGRLAYDPSTPETTFRRALAARTGGDQLWDAVQAASDIVPWIQSAHTCGPDQRSFAPDLEWGGPVGYWAQTAHSTDPSSPCQSNYHGPFDIMAFAAPLEAATDLLAGRGTSKVSPLEVARIVLRDAALARAAAGAPVDLDNVEARDVVRECVALADLGEYFGHKLRAATALAVYGQSAASDYLAAARSETQLADAAWVQLAADTAYIAPFVETMRMELLGFPVYHWSMQVPHLGDDPASIDAYAGRVTVRPNSVKVPPAATFLASVRAAGPGLVSLDVRPAANGTQEVDVHLAHAPPAGALVGVLWKEFSGFADWQYAPAVAGSDGVYRSHLSKPDASGYFAVEIKGGPGVGWRYPDVLAGAPYVVVSP